MKKCIRCSHECFDDALVCPQCGYQFTDIERRKEEEDEDCGTNLPMGLGSSLMEGLMGSNDTPSTPDPDPIQPAEPEPTPFESGGGDSGGAGAGSDY